jgi:hypothetical protein
MHEIKLYEQADCGITYRGEKPLSRAVPAGTRATPPAE